MGHGLSIWRIINDYPYFKQVCSVYKLLFLAEFPHCLFSQVPTFDEDEHISPRYSLFSTIPFLSTQTPYDSVFRLSVSPLGRQVAALHASGSLSIWDIPSLRKRKFWPLESLPSDNMDKTKIKGSLEVQELKDRISDVKWWSEDALIISKYSGAVMICSTTSLKNLLGESPEIFEGVPQVCDAFDGTFLGLENGRKILSSTNRSFLTEEEDTSNDTSNFSDFEEEEDLTSYQRSKDIFNKVMFWITDAER